QQVCPGFRAGGDPQLDHLSEGCRQMRSWTTALTSKTRQSAQIASVRSIAGPVRFLARGFRTAEVCCAGASCASSQVFHTAETHQLRFAVVLLRLLWSVILGGF